MTEGVASALEGWLAAPFRRAIVRIARSDSGETMGTGWLISASGMVVTCHHVIQPHPTVILERWDGEQLAVSTSAAQFSAEFDLALVPTGWTNLPYLPACRDTNGRERFLSYGFQEGKGGITDAKPLEGTLRGRTRVRYARNTNEYEVPAFELGSSIDGGSSGAPLFDGGARTVFGTIVASLPGLFPTGYAVPLADAASAWLPLALALDENDRTTPRFGRSVNRAATELVFAEQHRAALDWFGRARLYDRRRCAERAGPDALLAAFLQSGRRILPIVGRSGVGKSWWLAQAAAANMPLLRGLSIVPGHRSLADLLSSELRDQVWSRLPIEPENIPSETALVGAAAQAVLVLDALNEATLSRREMADNWVPATEKWLRQINGRLVVTCRPELWDMIADAFDSASIFVATPQSASAPEGALSREAQRTGNVLSDFSPAEAETALSLAGLKGEAWGSRARHPLLLGLAVELGELPVGGGILLIERYIDEKLRRAALVLGQEARRHEMRSALNEVARSMLLSHSEVLDFQQLASFGARDQEALHQLAEDHLLLSTPKGYRFQYDEIAEYLQAGAIDVRLILDPAKPFQLASGDQRVQIPPAVVGFALRRAQAKGDTQTTTSALRLLVPILQHSPSDNRSVLRLACEALETIDAVGKAIPLLEELALRTMERSEVDRRGLALPALMASSLPVASKIRVLRHAASKDNDYGWRPRDWHAPDSWAFTAKFNLRSDLGSQLQALASADPATVREALLGWLEDETPLGGQGLGGGGEARVGDVAAGCLFKLRPGGAHVLAQLLLCHTAPRALEVLKALVVSDANLLAGHVSDWLADKSRRLATLRLLRSIPSNVVSEDPVRASLSLPLLSLLASGKERIEAARVAARAGLHVLEAWNVINQARQRSLWPVLNRVLGRDNGKVTEDDLIVFLPHLPDEIASALSDALAGCVLSSSAWANDGAAGRIMTVLRHMAIESGALAHAVVLLRRAVAQAPPQAHVVIGLTIEHLLYYADENAPAKGDLINLVDEIIAARRPIGLDNIIHFAFGKQWQLRSAGQLREALGRVCLSEDSRMDVIAALAGSVDRAVQSFPAEKLEMLLHYRERWGDELTDHLILRSLFSRSQNENDPLTRCLLQFWRSLPASEHTQRIGQLLAGLESGLKLEDAWLAALKA